MKKLLSIVLALCLCASFMTVAVSATETQDVLLIAPAPTSTASKYSDVPADHWAKNDIEYWTAVGAINGFPDGTFGPDEYITRAQYATFISKAIKLPTADKSVLDKFTDADKNEWYAQHLANCVAAGIVQGQSATTVGPNYFITRQEAATMICRAFQIAPLAGVTPNFIDSADISDWAVPYVAALNANGTLVGYPDKTFKPAGFLTRAEAVHLTFKVNALPDPTAIYSMVVTIKGFGAEGPESTATATANYLTGDSLITTELGFIATTNTENLSKLYDNTDMYKVFKATIDAFTKGGTEWTTYAERMSYAVNGSAVLEQACMKNLPISTLEVGTAYTIEFVGYELTVTIVTK